MVPVGDERAADFIANVDVTGIHELDQWVQSGGLSPPSRQPELGAGCTWETVRIASQNSMGDAGRCVFQGRLRPADQHRRGGSRMQRAPKIKCKRCHKGGEAVRNAVDTGWECPGCGEPWSPPPIPGSGPRPRAPTGEAA